MPNNKKHIVNEQISGEPADWNVLLNNIESFLDSYTNFSTFYEKVKEGLKVFLTIPHAKYASIFLLEPEELLFDQMMCLPDEKEEYFDKIYDEELEKGTIGLSIDASKPVITETFNQEKHHLVTVPLTVGNKTTGIVLVVCEDSSDELPHLIFKLTSLMGGLYGNIIENYFIRLETENTKNSLEQKVAARTIDLSRSKMELNAILDSVQTAIIVSNDKTGDIIKSNPVAEKLTGLTSDQLKNRNIFELLSRNTESGDNDNAEDVLVNYKLDRIPILRNTSFLRLGDKNYRIESFYDITDIKETERKLNDANELLDLKVQERTTDLQLLVNKLTEEIKDREDAEKKIRAMLEKEKELSDMKSNFVAMISHEFRTPLTVIKSSTQLINKFFERMSKEERNRYLDRIVKTVDNMTHLIDNAIFITKSENHSVDIYKTKIDINSFIADIVNDVKLVHNIKRDIHVNVDQKVKDFYNDEKLLRLVIMNLLSNAVKYSEDGTDVKISAEIINNDLKITVEDKGIGIPDEEQDNIFNLFYRAGNVRNIAGTGLGMAVVVESVKLLDGKIDLWSKEKIGTKFFVFIPNKFQETHE